MSILSRIAGRFDRSVVGDGRGGTFFIRYKLFKSRYFNIYLHRFYRSDLDRCLHDHPWNFLSIVLWAGYFEEMADGTHWRRPGSVLWRPAATAHRIGIKPGSRPWSLVIVGRKRRDWGFWTRDGWRKWFANYSPICED